MQEEQLKLAQQSFHLVGSSASECDTIPGRQCMASSYFLAGQFEEVLVYLNSIKSFFVNDDTFNFNYAQVRISLTYEPFTPSHLYLVVHVIPIVKQYTIHGLQFGQAKVATGFYREAEECLLAIQDEAIRASFTYQACLCRCHVMNKEAHHAWEICVKV